MNHLDLCSGIGGFALAASWAGYETIGFCEIDPWCRRVLRKHWPEKPIHDDIKTLTADIVHGWVRAGTVGVGNNADGADGEACSPNRLGTGTPSATSSRLGELDLIMGGFPCQPFSLAGQRMGAEDDRHLWPHIAALVADLQPRRCLFENVYGHVSMGLDAVLSDLEKIGYTCGAVVVPACAVGAPHRRDRVWILADATSSGSGAPRQEINGAWRTDRLDGGGKQLPDVSDADEQRSNGSGAYRAGRPEPADGRGDDADADSAGLEGRIERSERAGERAAGSLVREPQHHAGTGTEALGGMGLPDDGVSRRLPGWTPGPGVIDPWAGEWEAGCPRTTTQERDRTHKLKALGNAIVPQVAYELLRFWNETPA